MKKIRLNGMEVLAGLDWSSLPMDAPPRKGLRDFLAMPQHKGVRYGVVMRAQGVSVVGTPALNGGDGDTSGKKKNQWSFGKSSSKASAAGPQIKGIEEVKAPGKTPSATALLALACQRMMESKGSSTATDAPTAEDVRWIVIQQIEGAKDPNGEDIFWMGVVMNGVPVPDGDLVAPRARIVEEILEIIANASNFIVYTADENIRYEVMAQVEVLEESFLALVRGIPERQARLTRFALGSTLLIIVVVAFVLIFGGWYGYSQWHQKQLLEAARANQRAQQAKQAQAKKNAASDYSQKVKSKLESNLKITMNMVKKKMAAPAPSVAAEAWADLVGQVDLNEQGWQLDTIQCTLPSSVPTCTITLKRNTYGVNAPLMSAHPGVSIDGDTATYTVTAPSLTPREPSFAVLATADDLQRGLMSDFQRVLRVNIQHAASASTNIQKTITLPPHPPELPLPEAWQKKMQNGQKASVVLNTGIATGTLALSGNALWQITGAAKLMNKPFVIPQSLDVKFHDGLDKTAWSLKGTYFIHTAPHPTIPDVPLDDKRTITITIPKNYHLGQPTDSSN